MTSTDEVIFLIFNLKKIFVFTQKSSFYFFLNRAKKT